MILDASAPTMNRQRSHSLEHISSEQDPVTTPSNGTMTPDRSNRKPGYVRTNFPKSVYNPPSPTPTSSQRAQLARNYLVAVGSKDDDVSTARSFSTREVRSITSEFPFDQRLDQTKSESESMGPGRIRTSATRPPPSPVSRHSPRNGVARSSPANHNNGPIINRAGVGPVRSFGDTSFPSDEVPARGATPPLSNQVIGNTLLSKSRDFMPVRSSPLGAALASEDHDDPRLLEEPPSLSTKYKMAPPRVSVPVSRPYDDEPSALTGDLSSGLIQPLNKEHSNEDEDDSLFDFEERNRQQKKKQQQLLLQQQRSPRSRNVVNADDETDDSEIAPFSLHERAQAAWKRKQRLATQEREQERQSPPPQEEGQPQKKKLVGAQPPVVSFGKDDIVHNYTLPLDDTMDDTTLGGRSLNSLYTKSAESEVEDIIKDIFMIGTGEGTNPGRRKFKHNPRIKEKLEKEKQGESFEDEDITLDTFDGTKEDETEDEDATFEDTTAFFADGTGGDTSATYSTNTGTPEDTTATHTTNSATNENTTATGTSTGADLSFLTFDGETTEDASFLPSGLKDPLPPDMPPPPSNKRSSPRQSVSIADEKKEEDDPLAGAWHFVEDGISAVSAAFGLNGITKNNSSASSASPVPVVEEVSPAASSRSPTASSRSPTATTSGSPTASTTRASPTTLAELPKPRSKSSSTQLLPDEETGTDTSYTAGSGTNTNSASYTNSASGANSASGWNFFDMLLGPVKCEPEQEVAIETQTSIEEDTRLVDLAMQAAVSMHRLNGYEFDMSRYVDINKEIKFSVVDLALPLGIIFQENEKGCFVAKIMPEGSAERTSGEVQIGDQLAAVDGSSAIDMTVDEIAKLVRVKKREVELTFLRYVGPLRPEVGTVIQEEGYEIRAADTETRSKKLSWSPPRQKSIRLSEPVKAVSPTVVRTSTKPKGILKNSITPPPIKVRKASKVEPPPPKEKKRFRLFGRRKK